MEEIREIYCVVVRMGSSSFGSAVRTFNNRKPESNSLRRVVRLSGFPPRWKPEIADQVRSLDALAGCRTKRTACASMKEWLPTDWYVLPVTNGREEASGERYGRANPAKTSS